jgi:hypothetical protein
MTDWFQVMKLQLPASLQIQSILIQVSSLIPNGTCEYNLHYFLSRITNPPGIWSMTVLRLHFNDLSCEQEFCGLAGSSDASVEY